MADIDDRLNDAINRGNLKKVKALVEKGADIEHRDPFGCTALLSAAWVGACDVIEYLLSIGADVNARDVEGSNALDMLKAVEQDDEVSGMIEALEAATKK